MAYTQPETITKTAKTFEVHYAYPTSPMAKNFGKEDTGTYYLTFNHVPQAQTFHTCREAHDFGMGTGRDPGFWSMKPH